MNTNEHTSGMEHANVEATDPNASLSKQLRLKTIGVCLLFIVFIVFGDEDVMSPIWPWVLAFVGVVEINSVKTSARTIRFIDRRFSQLHANQGGEAVRGRSEVAPVLPDEIGARKCEWSHP